MAMPSAAVLGIGHTRGSSNTGRPQLSGDDGDFLPGAALQGSLAARLSVAGRSQAEVVRRAVSHGGILWSQKRRCRFPHMCLP